MPVRFAITKQSGQGEQIVVDVCQWNPVTGDIVHKDTTEMSKLAGDMLAFADMRMEEMNVRGLEAYQLIAMLHPEQQQMLHEIMDVLAGRSSAALVKQRWDSIKEENADLQRVREEAAQLNLPFQSCEVE